MAIITLHDHHSPFLAWTSALRKLCKARLHSDSSRWASLEPRPISATVSKSHCTQTASEGLSAVSPLARASIASSCCPFACRCVAWASQPTWSLGFLLMSSKMASVSIKGTASSQPRELKNQNVANTLAAAKGDIMEMFPQTVTYFQPDNNWLAQCWSDFLIFTIAPKSCAQNCAVWYAITVRRKQQNGKDFPDNIGP